MKIAHSKAAERKIESETTELTKNKTPSKDTKDLGSYGKSETSPEPDFLWRKIPTAEKCELCGKFTVEYEINDIKGHQILRRCQSCFDNMRSLFSKSIWKHVQTDTMPSPKPGRAVVV